ncbi:LysR substrate-binding domain-containing protein, partial [Achromobacter ruhlandii]|uniref:LysR substrate-binding domain-containing protein n=1 Tax=Achromobacter ruhlandii TaxID=72557 RepID=UPI0020167578
GELGAFLAGGGPQTAGTEARLIGREPRVLALPADSPLCEQGVVPLRLLQGQPFVLYSPREGKYFYDRIVGAFGLADVQPDYVQRASQTHTLLALVRAGLGVGHLPNSDTQPPLTAVAVPSLGLPHPHPPRDLAPPPHSVTTPTTTVHRPVRRMPPHLPPPAAPSSARLHR